MVPPDVEIGIFFERKLIMKRTMTLLLGAVLVLSFASVTLTGCDEKGKCGCPKGKCTCSKPGPKLKCGCPTGKCACPKPAVKPACKCPKGKCVCPKPAAKVKKAAKACSPCGG